MASTSKQRSGSSGSRRSAKPTSRSDSKKASKKKRQGVARAASVGSKGRSGGLGKPAKKKRSAHISLKGILIGIAALAVVLLVTWVALIASHAFVITSIECKSTKHVDSATVETLADVPEGSTLLTVDVDSIVSGIKKNPWIANVKVERVFPDKLRIVLTERKVGAIVVMATDGVAWNLGDDVVWIEPLKLDVPEGSSASEVALQLASEEGCLLICDVPSSVTPKAGHAVSSGDVMGDAIEYLDGFSDDFKSQIVSFSIPSAESISCTLKNGVAVSLGSPENISDKETVIKAILEKYPDQITYINVRVPSSPSFRRIDADSVQAGTGATGDATASPDTANSEG